MKKQAFNPYLPNYEYIPDGEPYVFGDRVYVYGSHDKFNGEAFCMNDYVCWSAPVDDLGNWRYEGVIYRKEQDPRYQTGNCMFAPDITPGPDGRYYLYYTLDTTGSMAVAVADTPVGPFAYYGRVQDSDGHVLGDRAGDIFQFDPGVLVDDDGRVWLYSGFAEKVSNPRVKHLRRDKAYCMELERDMLTVKAGPTPILPGISNAAGTEFEEHPFFEASSIRKINGLYYLVYSSSWQHELCYAVSRYPDRDFKAGGTIVSNGDVGLERWTTGHSANYLDNNHGGLVKIGAQWYIFYHRHTNYHQYSRQACAEKVYFAPDGSIPQVEMTSCGLNSTDLLGQGTYPAAIACQLYAQGGACGTTRADPSIHPAFTQDGPDREDTEGQYITHLRQGSVAGFKYFDLSQTTRIGIQARGSAGVMYVYDKIGGDLLSRIPFEASEAYRTYPGALVGGKAHSGLFFRVQTEGSVDFYGFTLA